MSAEDEVRHEETKIKLQFLEKQMNELKKKIADDKRDSDEQIKKLKA